MTSFEDAMEKLKASAIKPQVPENSESLLDSINLENFASIIPMENEALFVSKIYKIYKKYTENPDNAEGILTELEAQIQKVLEYMEQSENDTPPEEGKSLQEILLQAFNFFYDGLLCLKSYFQEGVEESILDAFELLYRGDLALIQVEEEIDRKDKEDIFSILM